MAVAMIGLAMPWMMMKYKEYCLQARFECLEHSEHNPQMEKPQVLFKLLDEFLAK